MVEKITSHFEKTGFFGDEQFGFRKNNTETTALEIVENIGAVDARELYLVTFIDFSVAFNCIYQSYIRLMYVEACWPSIAHLI